MTDNTEATRIPTSLLDLVRDSTHDGPVWSETTEDLNVNLVVLRGGHTIERHVNSEVDVLLVGVEGTGVVTIDDRPELLAAGQLIVVPKGASRPIAPGGALFAYLTCHKRRSGLWPTRRA